MFECTVDLEVIFDNVRECNNFRREKEIFTKKRISVNSEDLNVFDYYGYRISTASNDEENYWVSIYQLLRLIMVNTYNVDYKKNVQKAFRVYNKILKRKGLWYFWDLDYNICDCLYRMLDGNV